jgi:hypothetical protein
LDRGELRGNDVERKKVWERNPALLTKEVIDFMLGVDCRGPFELAVAGDCQDTHRFAMPVHDPGPEMNGSTERGDSKSGFF